MIKDGTGEMTGSESESWLYRIEMEDGETHDFRESDLRPPIAQSEDTTLFDN